MVSDNQLYQYFLFVKDMLLEEVIREALIHSCILRLAQLAYHSGFGQVMQLCI